MEKKQQLNSIVNMQTQGEKEKIVSWVDRFWLCDSGVKYKEPWEFQVEVGLAKLVLYILLNIF